MKPGLVERVAYLGRLRRIFIVISLFAGAVLFVTGVLACFLLIGGRSALTPIVMEGSDPLPPPGDLPLAQLVASWASLGLLALAALVWLLWVFSATGLLKKADADRLQHGPFSAVAMHFVPVLAWAMPMLIMVELEKATRDPMQWRYLTNSGLAATSWFVAKMSWVAFASGLGLQAGAETADQCATSLWFSVVGAAGCMAGLYLFNRYLKHMEALQTALAARIDRPSMEATA